MVIWEIAVWMVMRVVIEVMWVILGCYLSFCRLVQWLVRFLK